MIDANVATKSMAVKNAGIMIKTNKKPELVSGFFNFKGKAKA